MAFQHKMKIEHCDGAEESLEKALKDMPNADEEQRQLYRDQLEEFFDRYARGERLSSSSLSSEGDLPDKTKFLAMRRLPIRAYFWVSKRLRSTLFISHYVYKKWQKLEKRDSRLVCRNWEKYEKG